VRLELGAGLTFRPATRDDAGRIFDIIAACETADDGSVEVVREDVEVGFERRGFDPARDTQLVFDGDDAVAWAEVYRRRAEADVRPSHRGRGIGRAILAWTEVTGRAHGDADVGQTKTDADARARELFLTNAYEPTHTGWILRIPLDGRPQPPAVLPNGITSRPYEPSDAREVHRMMDAAFCEWPGREPESFEVWAPQAIAHPAFVPALSPLAFDGDELVGAAISYDVVDADEGWVHQLATKATHRHRGIGTALLRTAFTAFQSRGRLVAGLATDSRTGAVGLYEKVGMHVERQYTRYTKPLV
jgi:ribosomal protein S18 acetylase RimI-like enzyme